MKRFTLLPLAFAVAASLNAAAAGSSSDTKTYPATGGTASANSPNSSSRENVQSNATGSNTSAGSMNGRSLSDTKSDKTKVAANGKSGSLSGADKDFLLKANQSGLLEIEASKLAKDRASSSTVKEFADMMVKDHGKASDELKQLASSEGVTLPTELDAKHKAKLDKLSKAQGADFDKAYKQTVGTPAHKEAVALFDKNSKSAKDPEVKAYAQKTLPTLKEHLAHAQQLDKTVASSTGARTNSDTASHSNSGAGSRSGSDSSGTSGTSGTTPAGASTSSNTGVTTSGTATPATKR